MRCFAANCLTVFAILGWLAACGRADAPQAPNKVASITETTGTVLLAPDRGTSDTARSRRPQFPPDERASERETMVRFQIAARGVEDTATLTAMRRVPRHEFVPPDMLRAAYFDNPLPIGHGQTISQPYIVASMTELLRLPPNAHVLEVGTGSGYQAAILAEIVDEVVSIEIIDDLARAAAGVLRKLGYSNVTVISGDGYFGWRQRAPYDAIIVTAAAEHIPPPLLAQLKSGGRMVIPVGPQGWAQDLLLVEKRPDGTLSTRNVMPVRFVPLTRRSR